MLRDGSTLQNSAFKGGREGTVDFNRKGNFTNILNALFPFFGAGVSGNARLIRAMMNGDKGAGKQLGLKIVMFGFSYSMLMSLWAGEDEETDEKHWDRLSDWSKKHNLNLFLKNGGDGSHISIPLPYGWNILYGTGSKLADILRHKSGNADRDYGIMEGAGDVLTSVVDTFHPMSGGHGMHRFVPHLVRPITELTYNENFLGNPIMPEDNPWGPGKPDSHKHWRSVNPISKALAQKVNSLTGGDDFSSGGIDFSPESLDHLLSYYTGTMGRQVWGLLGEGYNQATGQLPQYDHSKLKSIPVVSRLYRPETDDFSTEGRFLDLNKAVKLKTGRVSKLIERGDRALALKYQKRDKNYFIINEALRRYNSEKQFKARQIANYKKQKGSERKIQQLEKRFRKEKLKRMSQILKKARQLGIST
jgi:hypothetical protein